MRSSREQIVEAFDVLAAAVSGVCELSFDALTTPERLNFLERLEVEARRLPVPGHVLINQLAEQADESELGNRLARALADRLHITRGEAARRVAEAADLGERRALTGEVLPPRLTATADAQRAGRIGGAQVQVIRGFLQRLPGFVDIETWEKAEAHLAELAAGFRPDQLDKLADRLTDCVNPDGEFSDEDRARRRGLTMTKQDVDGMSRLSGWVNPELRATLEAIWAKLAAPGMCNPADQNSIIDGAASEDAVRRDTRSNAQRAHDGLNAALRSVLASGELGQHNGLPATIIVSTTLKEIEAASGKALTGGRTLLPMSDVIRLASHAHHYLAIFDKGKPIALYHTKRLASPGQRIVLYAKDRGCTRPGCDVPGYWSEVHHVDQWAATHRTDVDKLTLACTPDHKLLEKGWKTRKRADGDTEWIPPPHLDRGQPRINSYHHPEKLLRESDEEDDP
jgi:Domain of unknown function (DUF222)